MFTLVPPEGQEVLPGFADEKEKREEKREREQEVPDENRGNLPEEADEKDDSDLPF